MYSVLKRRQPYSTYYLTCRQGRCHPAASKTMWNVLILAFPQFLSFRVHVQS
jgi:hypothetical protein